MLEITKDMIEDGDDVALLGEGLDTLVELAKEDYRKWSEMSSKFDGASHSRSKIKEDMIADYNREISYSAGSKYVKVITGSSVWGFVVRVHNDKKFRFGDILKAAGWAAPARNFARGNVVDRDFRSIHWTGAG
jgi:hypothetical protein|tara:strand:+ start:265 stop:663 length:399 start_codon:yes stop_codon:yes gene_type:complete